MSATIDRVVEKPFGTVNHLRIAFFWFGFNFMWGAFLGPLLATQVQAIVRINAAKELGVLYSISAFAPLIIPLIVGPMSDRCRHPWGRRRPYILTGGLVTLAGLGLMVLGVNGKSFYLYSFSYLLIQVGANIALASYMGIIPDQVPEGERGKAASMMAVLSNIGTLFGAASILITHTGSAAQIVIGVVFAIAVIQASLFLPDTPADERAVTQLPSVIQHIKSLWIDPRKFPDFAWVWFTRFLMMVGFYMIQPFIVYYLRDGLLVKNAATVSTYILALILIAASFTGYFGGVVSDKVGRKRIVVLGTGLISLACISFVFAQTLTQGIAIGVLFGLGYGAYVSVDWALGTDVLPNQNDAAKDMSIWHIAMVLPQQIGPPLTGAVILNRYIIGQQLQDGQMVDLYSKSGFQLMFVVAAVFFLLSGVLIRFVKGAR